MNASPARTKEESRWQAEDDLRTLLRAADIRADKARYKAAMAEAKRQADQLAKVKQQ